MGHLNHSNYDAKFAPNLMQICHKEHRHFLHRQKNLRILSCSNKNCTWDIKILHVAPLQRLSGF